MHPVSRGFLDEMIERRTDHRSQIENIERAIRGVESDDAAKAPKKKDK
jgi:hypothetical protein